MKPVPCISDALSVAGLRRLAARYPDTWDTLLRSGVTGHARPTRRLTLMDVGHAGAWPTLLPNGPGHLHRLETDRRRFRVIAEPLASTPIASITRERLQELGRELQPCLLAGELCAALALAAYVVHHEQVRILGYARVPLPADTKHRPERMAPATQGEVERLRAHAGTLDLRIAIALGSDLRLGAAEIGRIRVGDVLPHQRRLWVPGVSGKDRRRVPSRALTIPGVLLADITRLSAGRDPEERLIGIVDLSRALARACRRAQLGRELTWLALCRRRRASFTPQPGIT